MLRGFASIFGDAPAVHIVVSEEAATYRPEMSWMANQLGSARFKVQDSEFSAFADGDAVYRFFELFDLANVPNAKVIFDLAAAKRHPPHAATQADVRGEDALRAAVEPQPARLLAAGTGRGLLSTGCCGLVPYTWIVDPAPLPPHAAIPELNLTDWRQLKALSQKERELILKVSGFSAHAWGARGVYLGSDLSHADWAAAVDEALADFERSPRVLAALSQAGPGRSAMV